MKRLQILCGVLTAITLMGESSAATFSVVNNDAANTGLNDTSSFTPVGGNNASTLGQARLNVVNEATRQWGLRLNSPQTIVVEVTFASLTCTTTSGTLASAGPVTFFTSAAQPNILLPAALADAITGTNNNNRNDISVSINSNVGTGSSCLNGKSFYLGFDHNNGSNVDLLNVLLHELGHGLGFISLTDSSGAPLVSGKFSAYDQFLYAESLAKFWPAMTNAERATAAVSNGSVTFNSSSINNNLSSFTTSTGLSTLGNRLKVYTPTTYSSGSSVSHWDTSATPSLLMEPFITPNNTGSTDLTGCVLRDIGWSGAYCPESTPVAQTQSVSTNQNIPLGITLLATSADTSRSLTYSISTAPGHGTVTAPVVVSSTSGVTFTYTPTSNYSGSDSFSFVASDGVRTSAAATINITITAGNNAPTANAQSITMLSGSTASITLTGSDPEGSSLTYAVLSNPANGTLSGTAPNLTYTPNSSFVGADSFTFRVNDGSLNSTAATITIQVNSPPTATSTTTESNSESGGGSLDGDLLAMLLGLLGLRWLARHSLVSRQRVRSVAAFRRNATR